MKPSFSYKTQILFVLKSLCAPLWFIIFFTTENTGGHGDGRKKCVRRKDRMQVMKILNKQKLKRNLSKNVIFQ